MLRPLMHIAIIVLISFPSAFAFSQESSEREQSILRTLNDYFPLELPDNLTADGWNHRVEYLRRHVQISLGLFPLPEKSPLNSVIHGKITMDDYTVEKVYFESFPGYFVTGNLYRPKNFAGKTAGVLCPHGHYTDGRFRETPQNEIENMLKSGEEKFASNARSPLQARCVHLARMGCTVFHYDMVGYADSHQVSHAIAHGFSKQRPEMSKPDRYGFFSPQAELHLQSIMGLQTWNSIRAIDFLESLDEVDASRIGVTGSSGGGTQTFILCAIDPRPAVAFPAVMVSTGMQGGCTCENCCNLRIGTGNVELAAMFAPKPMGLSAADDWTKEMQSKGLPELRKIYGLLEVPDNLEFVETLHFPHGYNQIARAAMYKFFNKHLKLNGEILERENKFLGRDQLSVWDQDHPAPKTGDEAETSLLQEWRKSQSKPIESMSDESLRMALGTLVDAGIEYEESYPEIIKAILEKSLIRVTDSDEETAIPIIDGSEPVLIFYDGNIDQIRLDFTNFDNFVEKLTEGKSNRCSVFAIDVLGLLPEELQTNRLVENGREVAAYTFGYNQTAAARKILMIRQILDRACLLASDRPEKLVTVISLDASSLEVATAAATKNQASDKARLNLVLNTDQKRFSKVDSLIHPGFLPGILKYGDLPSILAAIDQCHLLVFDDGDDFDVVEQRFSKLKIPDALTVESACDDPNSMLEKISSWIREQKQP